MYKNLTSLWSFVRNKYYEIYNNEINNKENNLINIFLSE